MTTLLTLLGPNGILYALLGAIVVAFGWMLRAGGKKDAIAAGKLKSAEDRLEMDREATDAERKAAELSDDAARKEALKWSKR